MDTEDIRQRINRLTLEFLTSVNQFSKNINVNQVTLSRQLNGRNGITIDTIIGILEYYPTVSPDWLLLGKGDIYRTKGDTNTISATADRNSTAKVCYNKDDKSAEFAIAKKEIEMLREQLADKQKTIDLLTTLLKNR